MNIAVIGAGDVGRSLGERLKAAGNNVIYGVRKPSGAADEKPVADAARQADAVLLTVPWDAAKQAVESLGDLGGKLLIDATNPIAPDFTLAVGQTISGGEQVQHWAKNARVVKAFNTTGSDNMRNPQFGSTKLTMFYAGDDAAAKKLAARIIGDVGFDPVDLGPLKQARYLEPLAMLWISLAMGGMGRGIALQLIRR